VRSVSEKHHIIPVWFFVGVLLLVYGVLIFVSGLAEWSNPPNTVLAELHAPVWWGGLLVVLGGVYCLMFRPGKST
jgi:FtsH-binding integral membrane protein